MKRKITAKLIEWKNNGNGRMPLLIYGARQVGKTFEMREFGDVYYKNTIYVNFETDERIGKYFDTDIHAKHIISVLEKYYQVKIMPESTLIIFDEIQMCERALTSLKYFSEETPEYHVIAAGSLLGVAIKREKYSFPVGKVQMLTMYPMDLEEVLWAKGKQLLADTSREHFETHQPLDEILHEEAMQEFYHYCIVGGMPAAVKADLSKESSIKETEIRQMLLNSYIADMTKYANSSDTIHIFEAYDSLPSQLAKDSKKFQYKLIKSGARASQYGDAIDWLIRAGIVNKCVKCTQGFYPVAVYQDVSSFKLYYSDLGIMSSRMQMTLDALMSKETEYFRGILTENYVAIALKTNGYDLHYWQSDNTAEVDFVIQKDSHVIPVECKAGNHVKAKSMMVYMERYNPIYAIRVSTRNFGMINGIKSVPLYSVFCI